MITTIITIYRGYYWK